MSDADIILAEVSGNTVTLSDCNVNGYRAPPRDGS